MLFEKKYSYYMIKFDDEKTYWYRSNSAFHRIGAKVIVPISNNGKWKIGTIVGKQQFKVKEVPYPIVETKGIVQEAGLFSEGKIKAHNNQIETSKFPPYDISVATIDTKHGQVRYITCQRERDLTKEMLMKRNIKLIVIENYPVADYSDIPYEAQKRLKDKENCKWDDFLMEMEDVDRFNNN